MSSSPFVIELIDNFKQSCFTLDLNLTEEYYNDLVLFLNQYCKTMEKGVTDVITGNNRFFLVTLVYTPLFSTEKKNVDVQYI